MQWEGKTITVINEAMRPDAGLFAHMTAQDRYADDISAQLAPERVSEIMLLADSGEPAAQAALGALLPEKNWDIFHALETRKAAVLGLPWEIEPGDDSPAAAKAAEAFKSVLDNAGDFYAETDTFHDLLSDLMTALLPGYAASEIIWNAGGKLEGFNSIEARHFTFRDISGAPLKRPRLLVDNQPGGVEIPPFKMVFHRVRFHGGDAVRGGLIRPLAWLHCFSGKNVADLLRFVERYGMPFVAAKVDKDTWDNERTVLKRMIRNFGPSGGGLFTKATEIELLQAASTGGDVYFKLLEYLDKAITKIILGQTATAGDGGGWSKDSAQSQVRQDILESDCAALMSTINDQLAQPWTLFNYGEKVASPRLKMLCEPPEDVKATYDAKKMKYDAMGVAIRAGLLTADAEIEAEVRKDLGLPPLSAAAKTEWTKNGGVKRPITLKDAPQPKTQVKGNAAALTAETDSEPSGAENAASGPENELSADVFKAATAWLANLPDDPDKALALINEDPEGLFDAFDSEKLAELIEKTVYGAAASGMADALRNLGDKA